MPHAVIMWHLSDSLKQACPMSTCAQFVINTVCAPAPPPNHSGGKGYKGPRIDVESIPSALCHTTLVPSEIGTILVSIMSSTDLTKPFCLSW